MADSKSLSNTETENPSSDSQAVASEKKKASWRAKLLLVFGSILFALLITEIALRIIGYAYPIFYVVDKDRGYALGPGIEGWYRQETNMYVRINSAGLRDQEHSLAKPANTIRVAIIGDSYAEALQVPLEKTFWSTMQEKLKDCPSFAGKQIEIINFGVSGYGTAQELITLREKAFQYSPDIVLLAFCTANDVSDNVRELKKTDIPYFVYRGSELVLDNSFQESHAFRVRESALNRLGRWVRDHLRVIQAIHQGQRAIKSYIASRRVDKIAPTSNQNGNHSPAEARQNAPPQDAVAEAEELGVDNVIYREPADEVWVRAWRVTEGILSEMRKETEARGTKFLVVTLSNGIQVFPDASVREQFMRRVGATDLFYPDKRVRDYCAREGIEVLTLAPAFQSYADQRKVFLHGFSKQLGNGHWNEMGHRLAGELITQKVCEMETRESTHQ